MIARKTTIDQHRGTHPGTSLPIYYLHDVITEYDLDASDPGEQAWVDEVHAARVALASLPAEQREQAERWLADHADGDDASELRAAVARAVRS